MAAAPWLLVPTSRLLGVLPLRRAEAVNTAALLLSALAVLGEGTLDLASSIAERGFTQDAAEEWSNKVLPAATAMVTLGLALKRRGALLALLDALGNVDALLKPPSRLHRRASALSVVLILVMISISVAYVVIRSDLVPTLIIYTTAGQSMCDIQFCVLSYILSQRFAYINEQLVVLRGAGRRLDEGVAARLGTLRAAHGELSGLVDRLGTVYGAELLVSVLRCYLQAVFSLYFAFTLHGVTRVEAVVRSVHNMARLLVVVLPAHGVVAQATRSAGIAWTLHHPAANPAVKLQVVMLSNSVLDRKIGFSVCGFFTLDTKLLTSLLAAGSTYLAIMLQSRPPDQPPPPWKKRK